MEKMFWFCIHQHIKRRIKKLISGLKNTNTPYLPDIPFVRKNGEVFFVDIASTRFNCNGSTIFIGFLRDRTRIIPKSCDWNLLYEQLAEMTGLGVFIVANRRFVYVNEYFVELLGGKSKSQFIEKEAARIIPQRDMERINCVYEGLVSRTIPVATVRQKIRKLDGKEIDCVMRAVRTKFNGETAIHSILKVAGEKDDSIESNLNTDGNRVLIEALTRREFDVLCLLAGG